MEPKSWFKDLTPYFIYILLVSTIGPLLFGFHLSELNAPQSIITCEKKSISSTLAPSLPQCISMDSTQFGLVSSIFTLGGLLGALVAGPVSARYGRYRSMLFSTVPFIIGPVFEVFATNIPIFTVGRLISGLGAGASVVIAPIFISEVAPPKEKGFFGAFTQIMINMGIFIAQLLGLFLSKGSLWRITLAVGGAIGILQAIGLFLGGQESPKWLADHGKERQAKRILRKLRGHAANIEEEVKGWGVESEQDMEDEEDSLLSNQDRMPSDGLEQSGPSSDASAGKKTKEAVEALGALAVLKNPDSRPAVIAVVVVMVGQQLCGINSIVMYGVSLLSDLLSANAALLNVLVAVLNIVVTTSCAPLTDKLGRKVCLLASIFGMGVSSLLLGIGIMKHLPILSAVTVLTFVASFGLGLGPVPFILSSELVGPGAVGATQSWALAANWIATFVVAQFFPIVNEKLGGGKVYFIFAAFAVLLSAFVFWAVPETKDKADADEVWGRKAGRAVD
ncbi:vacuolar protein sorting-associated protein 73 [Aureobasidium pullulans]|uniref:Vacuolar protein sorting-associated protein 73 n=1 Tax=Aureobasidium pullulans TaxID=5580 RepID=A0A4S9WCA7_AURPU|nr:vacuolar protein sorting-associated protein 73 [Aureobasidium pullulans]